MPSAAVLPRSFRAVAAVVVLSIGLGTLLGALAYRLTGTTPQPTPSVSETAPGPTGSLAPAPRVGAPAPEIGLADLQGRPINLESLRGQTVLVNFWASWCIPCEQEMADLQALYEQERERGFVIVGINEGEEPTRAATFLTRKGITFPTVFDTDMTVTRRYQVFGLPNSFFVDSEGIIRARVVGPFSLEQMRKHLADVRSGTLVTAPRVSSLVAAMSADSDRPAAEVNGTVITLGQVNRRLDLEMALSAVRGGLVVDLTQPEQAEELARQQRALAERLIDERVIAARAVAVGITIPDAEIDADLAQTAQEAGLSVEQLAVQLQAHGSDVAVLGEAHESMRLIGRFVAERVLTGMTEEQISDFDDWLIAARQRAKARVLL